MLSKSGFGMSVYLYFLPNKICLGFTFSERAQTSFFPIEKLSVVQDMRQWESKPRNYGQGCGTGAGQGGVCHSFTPTDAFSSRPSFHLAGSPKEDSRIQHSAFQCLIMERAIGERKKTDDGWGKHEGGRRKGFGVVEAKDLLGKGLGCERDEGLGFDEEGQLEAVTALIGKGS